VFEVEGLKIRHPLDKPFLWLYPVNLYAIGQEAKELSHQIMALVDKIVLDL
jgi:hypothetical protein